MHPSYFANRPTSWTYSKSSRALVNGRTAKAKPPKPTGLLNSRRCRRRIGHAVFAGRQEQRVGFARIGGSPAIAEGDHLRLGRRRERRQPTLNRCGHVQGLRARRGSADPDRRDLQRDEAQRLGKEFEEKFAPEIADAEVELTRLSALLGKIGL